MHQGSRFHLFIEGIEAESPPTTDLIRKRSLPSLYAGRPGLCANCGWPSISWKVRSARELNKATWGLHLDFGAESQIICSHG